MKVIIYVFSVSSVTKPGIQFLDLWK